ncbi:hypothetical protein ACFSKU_15495 [Pontibacter silvestris]|uniref:Uncharacterized protein n=1 Tax=Pontibacter silvestris TaxID=2305183 RepID=A0ABW4X0T0_9BACT|nr:hypothetical protein [Pontibacter silvestris]MCC9137530.1 hypothetical protein [Pontibacter silvestris]
MPTPAIPATKWRPCFPSVPGSGSAAAVNQVAGEKDKPYMAFLKDHYQKRIEICATETMSIRFYLMI